MIYIIFRQCLSNNVYDITIIIMLIILLLKFNFYHIYNSTLVELCNSLNHCIIILQKKNPFVGSCQINKNIDLNSLSVVER